MLFKDRINLPTLRTESCDMPAGDDHHHRLARFLQTRTRQDRRSEPEAAASAERAPPSRRGRERRNLRTIALVATYATKPTF